MKLRSICLLVLSPLLSVPVYARQAGQTTELNVDGIKVILKHSPNKVVSAILFIRGGTANYSLDQAGIENATFGATTECGTTTLSRTAFKSKLETLGSSVSGLSGYDNGVISLRCIRSSWDASWALFTDAILHPAFTDADFTIYKQKLISSARQRISNPDAELKLLAARTVFKGSNFEKIPQGTAESLTPLTAAAAASYYKMLLNKSRIFLVVVGNISAEDLQTKVHEAFAGLEKGYYIPVAPSSLDLPGSLNVEERPIATNYIIGLMGAPSSRDSAYRAFQLGIRILYDRLFIELRTKRNLSYAPGASLNANLLAYSTLSVSTTDPATSVSVMKEELNKIRTAGFSDKEVREMKSTFLTTFYMRQESNASQAQALGGAEILFGNWRKAETFTQDINKVSATEINTAFKQHINTVNWIYLGKKEQADPKVFFNSLN